MRTFILIIFTSLTLTSFSQAIRKNYSEMTETEKVNLVNAFYSLRNGADLINDMAVFHGAYFNFDGTPNATNPDIHFNLPDEPEREIFFAWHRRQLFELEQAMQNINPFISIPFWNSSVDQSINSPLWAFNFMGQFNDDWNLQRTLGQNDMLPMPFEVQQAQSQTDFFLYSDLVERGPVHHGAHRWVGGVMNATVSPRDPVFYLHHAWIDKLWKEWEDIRQSSAYQRTNMVRYDGTYSFNGQTLPSVNPNSIINARSLGTFYADNQLAILDAYTVNNTYNSIEVFFYQYTIQAQNGFIIPSGRTARFESVNQIRLEPGFHAQNGSDFIASIGSGTTLRSDPIIVRNTLPWDDKGIPINWDAYRPSDSDVKLAGEVHVFPNPFAERLVLVARDSHENWLVEVYDLAGRKVFERSYGQAASVVIEEELNQLKAGPYMLKVTLDDNVISSVSIIKQ